MDKLLPYFPVLFPVFFLGMWVLVTFVVSRMGWSALATRYEGPAHFTGTRLGIISGSVNMSNYKNALVLHYSHEGIYMRPVWIFRLFHKPVLIPWTEIKEIKEQKVLFFTTKELTIGAPRVATVTFSEAVFRRMQEYMPLP